MPRPRKPTSGRARVGPEAMPAWREAVAELARAEGYGSAAQWIEAMVVAAAGRRGVVLPERMPGHGGPRPVKRADDKRRPKPKAD